MIVAKIKRDHKGEFTFPANQLQTGDIIRFKSDLDEIVIERPEIKDPRLDPATDEIIARHWPKSHGGKL